MRASMYFPLALVAGVAQAFASPNVNVYWGQTGTDRLATYCQEGGFEFVTLAFVNKSPENGGGSDYPGTNFAAHCAAEVYVNNGHSSFLLSNCDQIKEDIKVCRDAGIKVLLSVGGEFNPGGGSNYTVSTEQNGKEFATFLWKAFGPFDPTWTGPRPFDISTSQHNEVDGFDFDIEQKFADQTPWVALIDKLQQYIGDGKQVITGAPQCPLADEWFQMKYTITHAKFDILWIQFYNNPDCDAIGTGFNFDAWESFIASTQSKDAKLYIGLPADNSINGYIPVSAAKSLIDEYKDRSSFGGLMFWDASRGRVNANGQGVPYYKELHDYLVAGPTQTTTTATTATPTTTSATTTSSASTSVDSTSYSSSSLSSTASFSDVSVSSSSSSSSSSSGPASNASSNATATSTTEAVTTDTASSSSASTSLESPSNGLNNTQTTPSNSTLSVSSTSYTPSASPHPFYSNSSFSASVTSLPGVTTSTVYTTLTHVFTSCPPRVHNCPVGGGGFTTTEVIALYTTVCPITERLTPTPTPTPTPAPVPGDSAKAEALTTKTVYTTRVYTITSCAPSVPNCPGRGQVTTEVIALYTTVCPATTTPKPKKHPKHPPRPACSAGRGKCDAGTTTVQTATQLYTTVTAAAHRGKFHHHHPHVHGNGTAAYMVSSTASAVVVLAPTAEGTACPGCVKIGLSAGDSSAALRGAADRGVGTNPFMLALLAVGAVLAVAL